MAMKITPDQLAALQLQQKNKARSATGEGFAQALAEELDSGSGAKAGAAATSTAPMARLDQTLQAAMLNKPTGQTLMDKMDTLLSKWENYSQIIGTADGNLREGYSLLADIRQDIRAVKSDLAQNPERGEGLETMVEELDILATTEEFKFNRGDYLN
jgi:hypothetical protein